MALTALLASAALTASASAGDLNPPAGPISPTFKTLSEVEPRIALTEANTPGDANSRLRISTPGSYYLVGNLSASTGRAAIEIDSDNVTVDLGGFWVRGASGTDSIRVEPGRSRVVIRNGAVTSSVGGDGIDAGGAIEVLVERVAVENVLLNGIVVGDRGRVINCSVSQAVIGIVTGENSIVEGCTADDNRSHGFDVDQGSSISRCTASNNADRGIYHRGRGSIVESSAFSNGAEGIRAENTTTVENCVSSLNVGRGIYLTLNANVRGSTTWQNESDGIVVGNHSVVANCNSTNNTGVGIQATSASSVMDNVSSSNTSHGIAIFGEAIVSRNNCTGNGFSTGAGSGIRSSGDNSRIDGNNCTNNSRGIEVTGSGNIIIQNTAAGNTVVDYTIVAGNAVGTIINVSGLTITTTATFANLQY
jgi:parallel beta-helix repeat protein